MDGVMLGRAHGVANLVGGLWPLLHISSFEMVFGPKTDRWLVKTVAGLLLVNGITQLTTSPTASGVRQARRLGVGTAAVLAAIDLVYVPAGRISKMYLVDAAIEVGWIIACAHDGAFTQSRVRAASGHVALASEPGTA